MKGSLAVVELLPDGTLRLHRASPAVAGTFRALLSRQDVQAICKETVEQQSKRIEMERAPIYKLVAAALGASRVTRSTVRFLLTPHVRPLAAGIVGAKQNKKREVLAARGLVWPVSLDWTKKVCRYRLDELVVLAEAIAKVTPLSPELVAAIAHQKEGN